MAECVGGSRSLTVLYSGGLDSSLVAWLAKPLTSVRLLVIGAAGSKDPAAARAGAGLLGLPLDEATIVAEDVARALTKFPDEFATLAEPLRSVDVALALALERAGDPRVLVGQGADELFYGYAHFRGLSSEAARARAMQDWRRLVEEEWPRAVRFAGAFAHEIRSPYLDPGVAAVAQELDPPPSGAAAKDELRRAAVRLGLPGPLAAAPKRALQYGSGVHRLLRRSRSPA